MATIQNDRDVLLQAAAVRVVPVPITIDQVEGLTDQLNSINNNISSQGTQITSVLNNTKDLIIVASRTVFPSATGTITLTATLKNGLTGTVAWAVTAGVGTLTPSGNTCTISGSTVTGNSVTVRARVSSGGRDYDSFVTLTKLGVLSEQSVVNLTNQVTGQLASGNITGLGALALLNTVDLNTQTTGALNGQTQVTNLGTLAYANSIAANQIGAGTLAAGVIYAGEINASSVKSGSFSGKTFTGGIFTGSTFRTADSGDRVEVSGTGITGTRQNGQQGFILSGRGALTLYGESLANLPPLVINPSGGDGHMLMTPKSQATFPAKRDGLFFWHSTHKLCISDGTNWYTVNATVIPGV